MLWMVFTAIAALVFLASLVAAMFPESRVGGITTAVVTAGAWLLFSGFFVFHTVGAGHVGLVKTWGDYTGQTGSGLVQTAPWQSLQEVTVRTQSKKIQMDKEHGSAVSKETQPVYAVVTLNYSIIPAKVEDLYTQIGAGYFDAIIEPRVRQVFKAETVKYKTIDVAPNREVIRKNVQETLDAQLEGFGIVVVDFLLDNLGFGQAFEEAIEAKQVATQNALAAEAKIQQSQAEANQARAKASGEADANKLLAKSLSPNVIEWERIHLWKPQIVYVPTNASIFVNPNVGK